jgi:phage tail tape-measure protein
MTAYEIMFHKAVVDLQSRYQNGAFDYARKKYRDFQKKVDEAHKGLVEAWKQEDTTVFREALKKWYSLLRRVFDEYKERRQIPPTERQPG